MGLRCDGLHSSVAKPIVFFTLEPLTDYADCSRTAADDIYFSFWESADQKITGTVNNEETAGNGITNAKRARAATSMDHSEAAERPVKRQKVVKTGGAKMRGQKGVI